MDRVKFWEVQTFAIITDNTKPAMKWTASELKSRGKRVYLVDLSEKPDPDSLKDVAAIPLGVDSVIIGVTKTEPGDLIPLLKGKGIKKVWLHWRTDTEKSVEACQKQGFKCITGYCPMMYLGNGLTIHGMHREIAKIMGKY
jgi:predicted CoA-binding protein